MFVSLLLFKHSDFVEEPVMPLIILIHERKLTSHHAAVFSLLSEEFGPMNGQPIYIDMELGIRNAIDKHTGLRIVGCWRHLRKDVENWLRKKI